MSPNAKKVQSMQFQGIPVSPGIQIGKVFVFDPKHKAITRRLIPQRSIDEEKERLDVALERANEALNSLRHQIEKSIDEAHASIFDFQIMMLNDPDVIQRTKRRIEQNHEDAAYAFMTVIHQFADQLAAIDDAYISGRTVDIIDVGNRVCALLSIRGGAAEMMDVDSEVVICASDLSPSDTAQLDHQHVLGFATELGGPTSHTAILAKALEIPAVVGLGPFLNHIQPGQTVIIDGYEGAMTINPTSREISRARSRRRRFMVHERDLQKLRDLPAETLDGYRVELSANVELPIEIPHVARHGCRGVGLFRTEFIFLESDRLPDEEEQFRVYQKVVKDVAPDYVICRTLDLGGDKFLSHPLSGRELNPFLGLRAIRLCLAYPDIFRTQLRALLRASAFGDVRIMFPLISSHGELLAAKAMVEETKDELREKGIAFDENIQVGCMIEIPSAALCAGQLAKDVDFFSIGTNDLIQYTLAVDRVNEQVATLYDPFHPAILKLIRMTINAAHREGIWVGVCGEMSCDPLCALMLIGLGVDELSMGPLAVPEIKRLIRSIRLSDAREIVEDIYAQQSSGQIHDYIQKAMRKIRRRSLKNSGALVK